MLEEDQLDGNHVVTLSEPNDIYTSPVTTYAHVDRGATCYVPIDEGFASNHYIPSLGYIPRSLEVIDMGPIESGIITHLPTLKMSIMATKKFVSRLGQ